MTLATMSFLDAFKAAANRAGVAEAQYRQQAAKEIAQFERERAYAFRRFNLMNAVADAVAQSEDEDSSVTNARAVLRGKLGWGTDSEARNEVLTHFAPVAQAVFRCLAPSEDAPPASVESVLLEFETWYGETHPATFWTLFENPIPETPLVDF
jgi:hypothetical protein